MKRFLLASLLLCLLARPAAADVILLCNDPFSGWCAGYGPAPGFAELYIQHVLSINATSSTFTIDVSQAPGTTFLGFDSQYLYSGTLGGPMSMAYGECKSGTFNIGKVFMMVGCGELRVAPATATDCSGVQRVAFTDLVYGLCTCGYQTSRCFPTPTAPATWGMVKALYR